MTSFRFAIGLIAMALVATPTVKATDLTLGDLGAGNALGSASDTRFNEPTGVEVLQGDEVALVADAWNSRIVHVSLVDGSTSLFLSTGAPYTNNPNFLVVCDDGVGYFSHRDYNGFGVHEFDTNDTPPRTSTPWVLAATTSPTGLACLTTSAQDLLLVADQRFGIRAYDRTKVDAVVWQLTVAQLGLNGYSLFGMSLSPDLQHLAFACKGTGAGNVNPYKVGTINIATKAVTLYESDGAANVANSVKSLSFSFASKKKKKAPTPGPGHVGSPSPPNSNQRALFQWGQPAFFNPYDVAWAPDGSKILVNALSEPGFSGLRFIDFATGDWTRSADGLMPTSQGGRCVTVLRSTGEVVMTYPNGLRMMSVTGVNPLPPPTCGNVPSVGHSDGGNSATAIGFVGDIVTYVCEAGFTAAGTSQVTTCQSDTTWSAISGCTIISCSAHDTTNTNAATPSQGLTFGTEAKFLCDTGYETDFTRQCQADGTWTNADGVCERKTCDPFSSIDHSTDDASSAPVFQDEVEVTCDKGYTDTGVSTGIKTSTSTCLADQTWTSVSPCKPISPTVYLRWAALRPHMASRFGVGQFPRRVSNARGFQ